MPVHKPGPPPVDLSWERVEDDHGVERWVLTVSNANPVYQIFSGRVFNDFVTVSFIDPE